MDSFVDYLEQNLIKEEKSWYKDQASEVLFVTLQITKCEKLLKLCNNAILRNPKNFFSSKEFLFIPRDYLAKLLDRDILGLEEIDVFVGVIMWGMNNTPNISHFDDFRLWSTEDLTSLKSTIIQFLNKVRFFHMQPEDFINKVGPLIKNFSPELYEQVIQYHSKKSTPSYYNILPLRLNSLIIREKEETALISYWIKHSYDKKGREEDDNNNNTTHNNNDDDKDENMSLIKTYEKYSMIPFNFHLIFRSNGNELKEDDNNNKWRQCCYNQGPTLTVIRTKDINEDEVVFGGFKSVSWSDNDIIGGGKGFIFGYLWKDDKLLLPWMMPVKNHFYGDKILGDGQLLFINFTNGNKLIAHANVWSLEETIEELEVFIVLHKDTL
ncbi:20995_t:CDS:1 [Entrophospora sp. SA101]|nr:20995_t:CDS:1 [Entrophospora sp. SA101]